MQRKAAEEITDLKKVQGRLIVELVQLCAMCSKVEQTISNAFQNMFKRTLALTLVKKAKQLGQTLVQLQDTNLLLQT